MAECFLVQRGGAPLNFKVVCNPQPSTAKENTIWVDTDKINNYYFSAEQPENMAEYDVWFLIGTSSTVAFSATKKNPIMVYPVSAKQYVSGAWVNKTAKTYQNGKWCDWFTYLFLDGEQYKSVTGGWIGSDEGYSIGGNKISLSGTYAEWMGFAYTDDPIDITNFNTLTIYVTNIVFHDNENIFGLSSQKLHQDANIAKKSVSKIGYHSIDISKLSGSYYVMARSYSNVSSAPSSMMKISEVYLS